MSYCSSGDVVWKKRMRESDFSTSAEPSLGNFLLSRLDPCSSFYPLLSTFLFFSPSYSHLKSLP